MVALTSRKLMSTTALLAVVGFAAIVLLATTPAAVAARDVEPEPAIPEWNDPDVPNFDAAEMGRQDEDLRRNLHDLKRRLQSNKDAAARRRRMSARDLNVEQMPTGVEDFDNNMQFPTMGENVEMPNFDEMMKLHEQRMAEHAEIMARMREEHERVMAEHARRMAELEEELKRTVPSEWNNEPTPNVSEDGEL